jgi:hypothetical protein
VSNNISKREIFLMLSIILPPPQNFPCRYAKNTTFCCKWIAIIILLALFIAGCGVTKDASSGGGSGGNPAPPATKIPTENITPTENVPVEQEIIIELINKSNGGNFAEISDIKVSDQAGNIYNYERDYDQYCYTVPHGEEITISWGDWLSGIATYNSHVKLEDNKDEFFDDLYNLDVGKRKLYFNIYQNNKSIYGNYIKSVAHNNSYITVYAVATVNANTQTIVIIQNRHKPE